MLFLTGLALYLAIGLMLLAVGPLQGAVEPRAPEAWNPACAGPAPAEPVPGAGRLLLFRVILSLAVVFLWPLLLASALGRDTRDQSANSPGEHRAEPGLVFCCMGGSGRITCLDCGHAEDLASFTIGPDSCTTGYQCRRCGGFATVEDAVGNMVRGGCACGGTLSRDHVLFCPKCRSPALHYVMRCTE